tara:strand:+ start:303 stop:485 length:183 start_codon:yes stop_codon:yes gene_type:complete
MSREFVDAIAIGNNIGAEEVFKTSVSTKVGDALEVKRKELANTFVKTMSTETEENDEPEV